MRLISEFVVAGREQAARLGHGHPDRDALPYFRCFNLDLQALVNLYFQLRREPYCDDFLDEFEVLHRAPDHHCAVLRMPDRFTRSLAVAGGATLSRVTTHWSETCGMTLRPWPADYRRRVLDSLARLACQSRNSNRPVLVCTRVDRAVTTETH
jgi:hypothetical protein